MRDEDFCKKVCTDAGIELFCVRKDIPAIAKEKKLGLEEAAREARYSAFDDAAESLSKRFGKKVLVATAHNADDNTETVLFNLTRGSALTGLCGIKRQRGKLIRPIITSTKEEIIAYCAQNGVDYIVDSTNSETVYTRNKLRHLVIPVLREINPSLSRSVARTGELLKQDDDYLSKIADDAYNELANDNKLRLDGLNLLHRAISSRVLYRFLRENGVSDCADVHIDAVIRLCAERVLHSRTELPSVKSAVICKDVLVIRDTADFSKNDISFDEEFGYGINVIEQTGDILARFDSDDIENISKFQNIYKISTQTNISSDKIINVLRFRTRKAGDTVNINGINRKVKKLLWEITDDPLERDRLPVIYDGNGILWIPGARSRTESFPKSGEAYQILFYAKSKDAQERIYNNEK